jgi:hypothetical protein
MGEINTSKPGDNTGLTESFRKTESHQRDPMRSLAGWKFDIKQSVGHSVTRDRHRDINIGWNVRQSAKLYDSNGRPAKT